VDTPGIASGSLRWYGSYKRAAPWLATTSFALLSTAAGGQQQEHQAVVWYRAATDCPGGPDFLSLLGERARLARLAAVGDHIDFVVTLAASEGRSHGSLERQTEAGTVAIREFEDPSCSQVAAALALSLGLALDSTKDAGDDPEADPSQAPVSDPAPNMLQANAAPHSEPARVDDSATAPTLATPMPAAADRRPPSAQKPTSATWWLGAQGGLVTGIAPSALGRAGAFVERNAAAREPLSGLALRAGVSGVLGSVESTVGPIQHWVLAARGEACPMRFGTSGISLWPCLGLDLGATGASGAEQGVLQETSFWSAVAASGRVRWLVTGPMALEAELGAFLPLTRYGYYAGSERLYESASVGVSAALGAVVALP